MTNQGNKAISHKGSKLARTAHDLFLSKLAKGWSVSASCRVAGLSRRTVYEWRDAKPEFKAAWDDALEQGTDVLEDAMFERAVDGKERPVYQGGELVGHVREYSDNLAMFIAKGRRPDKYRERVDSNSTGTMKVIVEGGLPEKNK